MAHVDVDDVKAEAERLRQDGVEVGVVLELHGQMRLLDVFDPDGNRIQLGQDVVRQHDDPRRRPAGRAVPPRHAPPRLLRALARRRRGPAQRYVDGWGRAGDRALVAIDDFHPVGAAWYRLFSEAEPGLRIRRRARRPS